jgi:hypothetical protein
MLNHILGNDYKNTLYLQQIILYFMAFINVNSQAKL